MIADSLFASRSACQSHFGFDNDHQFMDLLQYLCHHLPLRHWINSYLFFEWLRATCYTGSNNAWISTGLCHQWLL